MIRTAGVVVLNRDSTVITAAETGRDPSKLFAWLCWKDSLLSN
jgi:hypothetical protein